MAEEKSFGSVLFGSVAVLAIPAVIYVMGYIYWTEYFSHFGVDLAKVNLPVYKVMIGATPGVYVVIVAALLAYFVWKGTTRTTKGYHLPLTRSVFALGLIFAAFGFIVVGPLYAYWMWILLSFGLATLAYAFSEFVKGPRAVLIRVSLRWSWRIGILAIVAVPILLFLLFEYLSAKKAKAEADKLLGETCEECSFVSFHSASDTNLQLPDSLVLIASTESHYFVFSRTEHRAGKLTVFEVSKNSVSWVQIDTLGWSSEK